MGIDVVSLTKSHPKLSIFVRHARAIVSGRPYFFNRQRLRLRAFLEINSCVPFDNYIETGTYLGLTTRFFSSTARKRGAQVHSCELNEDYFAIAMRTVGGINNVHLHRGDSAKFIRSLSAKISNALNFVYLDAHWYDYLPLRDELSEVLTWKSTVVMIDDFQVPFDKQFNWDDGITLKYIEGSIGENPVYFPSYPAQKEGIGIACGYCVIPTSIRLASMLDGIQLLRRFS